ncbi:MAG: HAD hydrolase family protein [Phycisphaerae bacterium]|nr:HAD hydrolase family protein [Phycisphaerae bacterium]
MQDGTEGVVCDRSDGLGLEMLRNAGMGMLVLSKERNPVVGARCAKLRIECVQGIDDKITALVAIGRERGVPLEFTAYVGNDVNDVACLEAVGVAIAVADAYPEAMAAASLVTTRPGGRGAVREVCEWFLRAREPALGPPDPVPS